MEGKRRGKRQQSERNQLSVHKNPIKIVSISISTSFFTCTWMLFKRNSHQTWSILQLDFIKPCRFSSQKNKKLSEMKFELHSAPPCMKISFVLNWFKQAACQNNFQYFLLSNLKLQQLKTKKVRLYLPKDKKISFYRQKHCIIYQHLDSNYSLEIIYIVETVTELHERVLLQQSIEFKFRSKSSK